MPNAEIKLSEDDGINPRYICKSYYLPQHSPNMHHATAHIKRAIKKADETAPRNPQSSHDVPSEHPDPGDSVASDYTLLLDETPLEERRQPDVSNHVSEFEGDNPSSSLSQRIKLTFSTVSLLLVSSGLLHALFFGNERFESLLNTPIPLYHVMPIVFLAFLTGRVFEVFIGSNRHVIYAPASSEDVNIQIPHENNSFHSKKFNQRGFSSSMQPHRECKHEEISYRRQLISKVFRGKQKVKEYTHKLPSPTKALFSKLSLGDLEDKIIHGPNAISFSNDLMGHLLTYPDFSKCRAVLGTHLEAAASGEDSHTVTSPKTSLKESLNGSQIDTAIGHVKLRNSQDTSFQEEGFDSIVDPLCRLRGMDLFLADYPEEQIWKQPVLIE